jgi:Flp pilus assembly pilin Flp
MLIKTINRGLAPLFSGGGAEDGQALVEYSLLLLLVAVAALAAVRTFGLDVSKLYQSVINVVP